MQYNQFQQEIESDNDEGFIPSKIIIKQKKSISYKKSSDQVLHKKQFVPRYISEGIMRKEPPQCYKRFSKFDYIDQQISSINPSEQNIQSSKQLQFNSTNFNMNNKIKNKQKLLTPYDKFIASGQYHLVYSRYKDFSFSKQQVQFAKNQIKLECLKSKQDVNYKQIKSFQIIENKNSQINKQSISRHMSTRQKILKFDSRFQCGNLLCAFKSKNESYKYYLFIQNDTNTNGYNQWFYFSINNAQVGIKYQFNILNFRKRNSFFKQGNKPVIFSLKDSKNPHKNGYSKRGDNVIYKKSPIIKSYESKQKFFQLSFQIEFFNQDDIHYISMGLPYSYSKLIHNLNIYEAAAKARGIIWNMDGIGTTISGNKVPYITITKPQNQKYQQKRNHKRINTQTSFHHQDQQDNKKQQDCQKQNVQFNKESQKKIHKKRVILVIARQHPGQTWSSYLVDQFLYSISHRTTSDVDYLLDNFIIKCIPMINIDGVINGNFRCDLSGVDLNRNWKNPSSILHPQIYSIKNQINNLVNSQGYKIQCCFDLHGHSKQYNIFCYSCKIDNIQCRILPYIFQQFNNEFHFSYCTFGISKYKQSTARAVIFNLIKNTNVLTIQSSFFASKINNKVKIFQPQSFQHFSQMMLKGCKSYFSQDDHYQVAKQIIKLRLSQFLMYKQQSQNAFSGSDSQPSGDQIDTKEKFQKILPKCLIKECLQQQKSKKIQRKPRNSKKRQTIQVPAQKSSIKLKKFSYNSQHQNRTLDVIKDQSISKIDKKYYEKYRIPARAIQQKTISFFKKKSDEMLQQTIEQSENVSNRKLYIQQLLEKDEKKLPFFAKQKPQMVPMKLKNQSFQIFRDAYNATQKHIKHDEFTLEDLRNQRRNTSKKLGLYRQRSIQKEQQFPLLCVLSQNKKKNHVQKLKQKYDKSKNQIKSDQTQKVKTAIQTRTQAIKQLRQKNKNSMQLVSKIWRQNFTRYGMAFSTFKISK